ncbi:MAG: hypothetical protein HZC11_01515 [Nitrospirae bacterium]|nr:hypothetical protein [Nitrospirota bacterium]
MKIIPFITVNLLLFVSWYVLLYKSKNYLSFADRLLGTVILALSQIILTEMILGILFKKLFAAPLFILNVSVSLIILVFAVITEKINYKDIFSEIKDKASQLLNIIKSDRILLSLSSLFFIYLSYLIFISYLFPSYSWDSLLYHLPILGYILQAGAIQNLPDHSLLYIFLNIFPKNIELFFLWNVIFLKSSPLADLSQMFFTLAGMLSIYSMAAKLKINKRHAIYSSLLFFFAPVIILQSTMEYVDIAVSVLFLIALNFLMYTGSEDMNKKQTPVFYSGLAGGVLLGSKGSGPLFIVALSILILMSELKRYFSMRSKVHPAQKTRQTNIKEAIVTYIIFFIVPVILFGGYWYIQNWAHYNNPVYPFEIKVLNRVIFPGIFTEILDEIPQALKNLSPAASLIHVWLEKEANYIYYSYLSGLGPVWFILLLPATVFSIFLAIRGKRYDFLFIAGAVIFTFIFSPRNWNPRYVIFILGLGGISFALMLDYFNPREKILQILVLIFVLYTVFASNSTCITPEKIKKFALLPAKERTLGKMDTPCLTTQRGDYGLWDWINKNVSRGQTLAYTFEPLLLAPLWNSDFSSRIVYVKGNALLNWHKNLKLNNADYALIWQRSMEKWWISRLEQLKNTPEWSAVYEEFKVVYSDKEYMVLKVGK